MSCDPLTVGDAVRISITVRDINGTLADPTALVVTIKTPDAQQTPVTPTRIDAGVYYFDIDLTMQGSYAYRVTATGQNRAVGQGGLFVYPNAF